MGIATYLATTGNVFLCGHHCVNVPVVSFFLNVWSQSLQILKIQSLSVLTEYDLQPVLF